jgi:hypothetical protein
MRTTVNLYDNIIRELRQKANKSGKSLKEIVNMALREGLKESEKPRSGKPYKCKTFSFGYPPRVDLLHALNLADQLE